MDRRRELLDRIVSWSPVLLLGALAAFTYWLDAQVQPPAGRRDGSSRHDPDLFLEDFRTITFDAQGRAKETLSAARAEHFPDDNSAELTQPNLALSDIDRPTLTISAQRGRIDGDRNQGDFIGDVRVQRQAAPQAGGNEPSGPITLRTESLHVLTREQRVQTDKAVTIEEPRGIIRGKGLDFDNKGKTVRLQSNVNGTLQPQDIPK
jgi:lipopolysaccharide export system protein LptC